LRTAALWLELNAEDPLGDVFADPFEDLVLSKGGSSPPGTPFLTDVLSGAYVIVEAAFGASVKSAEPQTWTWYDITTDVRQADGSNISITIGRADESSQASPGNCQFALDNTSGNYSKDHPGSKYWPYVRRNTPLRVRLYINGTFYTRFQGYVDGWVPSWDESANLAIVSVSASGVLRRLQQGKSPLQSSLFRAIHGTANLVQYWPCEDGSQSVQAANDVAGGNPLVPPTVALDFSPAPSAPIKFAAQDGPSGSASLPEFQVGSYMATSIATTSTTSWRVDFVLKVTVPSGGSPHKYATAMQLGSTGDIKVYEIDIYRPGEGGFTIALLDKNNVVSYNPANLVDAGDGNWHYISIRMVQNGAGIDVTFYVDSTATTYTITPAVLQPINEIFVGVSASNPAITSIGHIALWEPTTSIDIFSPASGWSGETSTTRFNRLCGEQSIFAQQIGPSSTTTMGPQGQDTFTNILREDETTEDGLLVDGLSAGLTFISRSARYNAVALMQPDMAADPPQVDNPFAPTDDDQRDRNIVKVDRKNGSSATVESASGDLGTDTIGDYDTSVTVNTQTDDVLLARAAWEVNKGTAPGFRYPTLAFNLAATPLLISTWLSTSLSGRIDVLNVTSKATQHPPGTISQILEGYNEVLTPFDWDVVANCSPYGPWRVAVVEGSGDTEYRVDSDSSTLSQSYAPGVTSISVATSGGTLWTTSASDFPMDLSVGGIQVTATAASGSSSPQTFTVNATSYGLAAGSTVKLWRPPVIAL
jgi:hypothetical protein